MPLSSFRPQSRTTTWPAAVAGGVVGTAAMTATLSIHSLLGGGSGGLIDYDATDHVTTAASKVIRWTPTTERQQQALFALVHWGYGSAVAIQYDELRRRLGDRRATIAFWAVCQTTAFVLFPVLGGTPPPWRWRANILVSSIAEHALYAVTVAAVSKRLRDS